MGTNTPQLLKWPAPVAQRYDEMVTSTAYLVEITWTERIQRKQWGWASEVSAAQCDASRESTSAWLWQQPSLAWPAWTTIKEPMIVDKVLDGIQRKKVQETSYLVPQISFFLFFLIILFLRLYSTMNNRDSESRSEIPRWTVPTDSGQTWISRWIFFQSLLHFSTNFIKVSLWTATTIAGPNKLNIFLPQVVFLAIFFFLFQPITMLYSDFSDSNPTIITR